jgi:hypothetical protein
LVRHWLRLFIAYVLRDRMRHYIETPHQVGSYVGTPRQVGHYVRAPRYHERPIGAPGHEVHRNAPAADQIARLLRRFVERVVQALAMICLSQALAAILIKVGTSV